MTKKNKKSKLPKIIALLIISLVFVSILAVTYSKKMINTDKIQDNVFINGVDVSKLTKEDAKKIISEKFKYGDVKLLFEGKEYVQNLASLGFGYNIDEAVAKAYSVGRKDNLIKNSIKIIKLKMGAKEKIELTQKEDFEKLDNFYKDIASNVDINPKDASIDVDGGINITPSQQGRKVDIEKLKSEVKEKIKLSEDKNISMQIPVAISEPTIKESQLQAINGIIAEYRSRYNTSNAERSYNVALTAQKLDKQLLMPGQEISFMNTLGDISIQSGFKTSKIIVNNEYQDGVGGGVCQVSSTLYNALLMSGIDIIQRTNHSFPVGYVPTGRDATVAIGGPDLKFRNNYDFPIFVKTYAYNGVMVADIYGDTTKAKRYDVFSEITKTIEPTVIYKDDPTLPKGKEVVEDFGHTGYTAVSYKIANGKKTQISTDSYTMTPKIIKKGTGAPIEPEKKEDKKETTQVEKNQTQTTQKVKTTEPKKETNEASIVF